MISKEKFFEFCNNMSVSVNDDIYNRLDTYAKLLVEWNKKVNLTSITEPDEILIKHFIDSIFLLKYVDIPENGSFCDVGTGAGFPGVVVSIMRPDINVTLIDSIGKKLAFVEEVIKTLSLNAKAINMRAEDAGKNPVYREKYDVVSARAVSQLNKLSEYCIPLVKIGGVFSPLKAVLSKEEAQQGFGAAVNLGAKLDKREIYSLPDNSEREIIIFKKISATSPKFPRNSAQISKKPL